MKIIETENAPAAIGPYSQAIAVNGLVYTSGQIPIDPRTGNIEAAGIEAQTEQAIRNLSAVLEAAGSSADKVIKTTCFLRNMDDFAAFNGISFREHPFELHPDLRKVFPREARAKLRRRFRASQGRAGRDRSRSRGRSMRRDGPDRGDMRKGVILAVCVSERRGVQKHPVEAIVLRPRHGIVGDAHAGDWHRQVSLPAKGRKQKEPIPKGAFL